MREDPCRRLAKGPRPSKGDGDSVEEQKGNQFWAFRGRRMQMLFSSKDEDSATMKLKQDDNSTGDKILVRSYSFVFFTFFTFL